MADIVDHRRRSQLMARVRQKNTGPELEVRKVAHALGFRFRLHRGDLPGRPDVVLPKYRTAILVHDCFWHRHEGCQRTTLPKSRRHFWQSKFKANIEHDRKNISELRRLGWKVCIIWECETYNRHIISRKLLRLLPPANRRPGFKPAKTRRLGGVL
jgi:DNA mismatch endonuclease, patch repair protein